MDDLGWIECQGPSLAALTLSGESILVPALGRLGKQRPAACFIDSRFIAGVDRCGWLNLWDSASGKSLVRMDPLAQPMSFDKGLRVAIAGDWVLGVNVDERRIQGYRFPYGSAVKIGYPCFQSGKQAMLSDDGKHLWLIDLVTAEIEELFVQIEVNAWDEEQGIEHWVLRELIDQPMCIEGVTLNQDRLSMIYRDYSGDWGDSDPRGVVVYDVQNRKWIWQQMLGCREFVIQRPGYRYQYLDVCDGKSIVFRKSSFLSARNRALLELSNCNSSVFNMAISSNGCTLAALIGKLAVSQTDRIELLVIDIVHRKLIHRKPLPAITEDCRLGYHIEFSPSNRQIAICGSSTVFVLTVA
ncbi:MAG: hypothetical protein KDB03_01480 [Planctomycetales bacterium]|nr:hypothetical protein [Planctomycetales bacterium]